MARLRADAVVLAAEVELGRGGTALLEHGDAAGRPPGAARAALRAASTTDLHVARAMLRRGDLDGAGDAAATGPRRSQRRPLLDVRLLDRDTRAALHAARGRRVAGPGRTCAAGLADLHAWQSSFGSLDLQTNGGRVTASGSPSAGCALAAGIAVARGAVRVVRARPDAGQPGAAGARARRTSRPLADLAELRAGPDPAREAELRQTGARAGLAAPRVRGGDRPGPARPSCRRRSATTPPSWPTSCTHPDVVALVVTRDAAVRRPLGDRAALEAVLAGLPADLDLAPRPARSGGSDSAPGPDRTARVARGSPRRPPPRPRRGPPGRARRRPGSSPACRGPCCAGGGGVPSPSPARRPSWVAAQEHAAGGTTALGRAGFVAGPGVPRADAEVTAAAATWPDARVLTGPDATAADAVADLAASVDVLHVAAHGRHAADSPLFSGLELCLRLPGTATTSTSSPAVPRGRPAVVVRGGALVGAAPGRHCNCMTTAWLHAGVRWVVASPAAVGDAAAHEFLLTLHAGLRDGLTPPEALARVVHPPDGAPVPFISFS